MEGEADGLLDVLEVTVVEVDAERVGAGGAVYKSRAKFKALGDIDREGEPLIEEEALVEVVGEEDAVTEGDAVGEGEDEGQREA